MNNEQLGDSDAREMLRQVNVQLLAADARMQAALARSATLQKEVEKTSLALETSKMRAEKAESRLAASLDVLGPPLMARIRRGLA